jgi:hypothetical protein
MWTKIHNHSRNLDSPGIRRALLPAHKKREQQLKHKKTFCGMAIALFDY